MELRVVQNVQDEFFTYAAELRTADFHDYSLASRRAIASRTLSALMQEQSAYFTVAVEKNHPIGYSTGISQSDLERSMLRRENLVELDAVRRCLQDEAAYAFHAGDTFIEDAHAAPYLMEQVLVDKLRFAREHGYRYVVANAAAPDAVDLYRRALGDPVHECTGSLFIFRL